MLEAVSVSVKWGIVKVWHWTPLLFALLLLPVSYFVKLREEIAIGYTFRWVDWICLEFPVVSTSFAYGIYATTYASSELVWRSRKWWNGALAMRFICYIVPLSIGVHSALKLMIWFFFAMAWFDTHSRKVWHRPITHIERYCIYWSVGLSVSVSSSHVGECLSSYLAWRQFGSIGQIVVTLMIVISLLHTVAIVKLGNNIGFLMGTVWETCVILAASFGHHHTHIGICGLGCGLLLLLVAGGRHYMEYRRMHYIPPGLVAKQVDIVEQSTTVKSDGNGNVVAKQVASEFHSKTTAARASPAPALVASRRRKMSLLPATVPQGACLRRTTLAPASPVSQRAATTVVSKQVSASSSVKVRTK